jgi:hypothetical protein
LGGLLDGGGMMKIGYRNYPILEKLHNESLGKLPILTGDIIYFETHYKEFSDRWKMKANCFKKEINVISEPFFKAVIDTQPQLTDLLKDIIVNDIGDFVVEGCYIYKDFVYMMYYEAIKGSEDMELFLYIFHKDGTPIANYVDSCQYDIYQEGFISSFTHQTRKQDKDKKEWLYESINLVWLFRMFKTYAQVETKIVNAKSKSKTNTEKYLNDTDMNLTFLDSKWFTNLVRSDGFSVRGHFRLQPKKNKDGQWTRELIWINQFQKSGYTAPARKTLISQ